ncbi:hypothetical protein [Polaromonas sp. AER18D-145]|uniref:hypothetical protein n=1 Tax=Polaromonas sp. AER18D-145 TaxID=1977060 RepID=UPI00197BEC9D|nr:hypothetical protein [Polaromonas sp. AER18D-145]
MKLPRASVPIALASAVSLTAQVLFSLLMLRLFTPQAVGEFSIISQVAFFWMTLALAQSPLSLLADLHRHPIQALWAALGASLLRLGCLMPLAWMGVHLSGLALIGQTLAWAALLALLQLGWYLAQPLTLKTASVKSIAVGRAMPPLIALAVAGLAGILWPQAGATGLLLAAAAGYAAGALWLLPLRRSASLPDRYGASLSLEPAVARADDRSMTLRLAHTAIDALTGTAILLLWQRSHGAAEVGFLAVVLRLLGFVPAVIHTAWAQVLLAEGSSRRQSAVMAGLLGALLVAALALACNFALRMQWLSSAWAGVLPYLLPLALWQGVACMTAAFSHLPFQQGRARTYSYMAMGFDALQLLVLCAPLVFGLTLSTAEHVWYLAGASAAGLFGFVLWLVRLATPAQGSLSSRS